MKTAPVMPPPRPPRDGDVVMGFHDWNENPNAGRWAKWRRFGRMLLKFLVLILFAIAVGQLALIVFQIVRLQFVS
ncbi:MAG: hypothetical protein EPO07_19040 [Verrucomicrobia bacterium]|nr:MAG: hypothetical protein EPO07_19040 [Verrucomicrobiota bacterium]